MSRPKHTDLQDTEPAIRQQGAQPSPEDACHEHPVRGPQGPLHLLVDSTGIKVEGEGAWNARKHDDAPVRPELLRPISPDQEIATVTANGAYNTRKCHDAIAERGAHAVIPPRKNTKPWKAITTGAAARNKALRASKHRGRALWRRWRGTAIARSRSSRFVLPC